MYTNVRVHCTLYMYNAHVLLTSDCSIVVNTPLNVSPCKSLYPFCPFILLLSNSVSTLPSCSLMCFSTLDHCSLADCK